MRRGIIAIAASLALIVIGTLEAAESARQIAELTTFTRIRPNGAGLSALGLAASTAIYVALGWWLRDDRAAVRTGALVGLVAGVVGGSLRALLIADAVREAIARNAVVPEWFVGAVLVAFVVVSAVVTVVGGATLTFAGSRLGSARRAGA